MSKQNHQQNNDDIDLDKALDQFDNNQLNLTNQQPKLETDQDPQIAAKVQEEYLKFMQEMKNFGAGQQGGDGQGLDSLTSMFGGLLKNLMPDSGLQGDDQNDLGKGFQQIFKSLQGDNIQQAAGKLLSQFMDKNLLYQPMIEVRQKYDEYFKKSENGSKVSKEDNQRYKSQYSILKQIIETLDKTPENKQHLIQLFEKMQQYGNPPTGIDGFANFSQGFM